MSELTAAPGEHEGLAPRKKEQGLAPRKKEQREGLVPRKRVASRRARRAVGATLVTMAWRNLWRVRRRTWLTAGGVAFAVFLLVLMRSMHMGVFGATVDLATKQMAGHAQVQHPQYLDDPRMRYTVEGLAAVTETLKGHPGVRAVAPRGMGFALVSADSSMRGASPSRSPAEGSQAEEISLGAQVMGIDPSVEFATLSQRALPGGRALERAGEGLMGSLLARNLGAQVGGDIIVLGTGKDGGVAATAVTLVGLFESGNPDLDRSLLMVHFDDFSEAFGLEDEAHVIAVLGQDANRARDFAADIAPAVENAATEGTRRVLPWQDIQPELEQFIVLKAGGLVVLGVILIVIVTFVVVSAFVMTVFERTAEFGMLKAIGMPPGAIFRMVQFEGLWMSLLGVALGVAAAFAAVSALSVKGIPVAAFGEDLAAFDQLGLPEALVPAFSSGAALLMTAIMIVAVQVAAAVPAPRIWRLKAVEALRDEE